MKGKIKFACGIVTMFIVSVLFVSLVNAKVVNGISVGSNRDFLGGDYAQFNVKTLDECIQRCAEDQRCKAFAFAKEVKACALKDRVGEEVKSPGMESGHKL